MFRYTTELDNFLVFIFVFADCFSLLCCRSSRIWLCLRGQVVIGVKDSELFTSMEAPNDEHAPFLVDNHKKNVLNSFQHPDGVLPGRMADQIFGPMPLYRYR